MADVNANANANQNTRNFWQKFTNFCGPPPAPVVNDEETGAVTAAALDQLNQKLKVLEEKTQKDEAEIQQLKEKLKKTEDELVLVRDGRKAAREADPLFQLVQRLVAVFDLLGLRNVYNRKWSMIVIATILWGLSWSLIFMKPEASVTKWVITLGDTSPAACGSTTTMVLIVLIPLYSASGDGLKFGEGTRLSLTTVFAMFSMCTEGHFTDKVSFLFALGLALWTIPVSILLNMEDDIGIFEVLLKPADDALKSMGCPWYIMVFFTLFSVYCKRGVMMFLRFLN